MIADMDSGMMTLLFFGGIAVVALLCYIYYLRSRLDTMEQILNCIKCNNYSVRPPSKWIGPFKDDRGETINNVLNFLNERYLQQQEQLFYFENLMSCVDSALIVVDEQGKVNWCNRAARTELLGYAPSALDQLSTLSSDLPGQLDAIRPGEVKPLRFERDGKVYEMAVTVNLYQSTRKQNLRIINLRNIHQLLLENEQQTTHRLMRVLTHEMMNSLTPIIALSGSLKESMKRSDYDPADISEGIEVIRRRSDGLLRFVNNYRKLSKLEMPVLQPQSLFSLLDTIRPLTCGFKSEISFPDANTYPAPVILNMDRVQIEQVLLNLLKNADEACAQTLSPRIEVELEVRKEQVLLHVSDNGEGISPAALERVFVPFYTTKQKGSGIGLALCRQIMNNHGGNITVQSTLGNGSCFTLHFVREAEG